MLIIPAIDLKDGLCVRLRQGDMDDSTVFSDQPTTMASQWVQEGARRLHVVDLNGAFAGYLKLGVNWVIIGTQAVKSPEFVTEACKAFPEKIIIGLDAKEGYVATEGWAEVSNIKAIELAKRFEQDGVSSIIYTDIARDGMMQGVNMEETIRMAQASSIPIIASGGVTNMDDIRALQQAESDGVIGAITGRAIYEGTLDLETAQKFCDETASAT